MDYFHLAIYFILLLCQVLQAQALCGQEVCGNVAITPPFGISSNCFNLSSFRVTCKRTLNVDKPFIYVNGIDIELLGSVFSDTVLISNPVTNVACDHKTDVASSTVDLTGTPFYFPSEHNYFGSAGCGNLATVFSNQGDVLGGCIQPICGNSDSESGCFTEIYEDVASYNVNMTQMYAPGGKVDGRKGCTSGFMFSKKYFHNDYPLPVGIDVQTTHVPATIMWNSTFCGDAGCEREPGRMNFNNEVKCGNVTFQTPRPPNHNNEDIFITNDLFGVICKFSKGQLIPFLRLYNIDLQILDFSFLYGSIVVNHPITYLKCRQYGNNGMSLSLGGTPYYYSDTNNVFWSSGCGNLATVFHTQTGNVIGGCLQQSCRINNETSNSAIGCLINIPLGLTSFFTNMSNRVDSNGRESSCRGFSSLVNADFYHNLTSKLEDFNTSRRTHVPTSLQWSTPISANCYLMQGSNISCSSNGEFCWQSLGPSHLCVCSKDRSIPYSTLCREETCEKYKWCHMLCLNTPGNYCSSHHCPLGYRYNSTKFRCEKIGSLLPFQTRTRNLTIIIIGCSTSIGTVCLLLGTWQMYKVFKRRQNVMLKQKYFKRNGGLLLQQHLSSNGGNVDKLKLFMSKEMEKATDYYNKNRILGQGGQGTVYKGMLADGSIVAIKKSKMVEGKKIVEIKVEQFVNEVIILSQINHRNVVKLLGCCLEAEVPLLVYEFVPNGTLYDLIHSQNEEFPLTWEMRIRIAVEIANALFYLHSAASVPIYHRDIKSSNILLDDKYRTKVSDFGTSRSIALEQTHLTTLVQGTFGYMDPEYFRSSQFTEKSDVYSFGVVLVELLTGQKPISSKQSEEVRSLVSFFLLSMQEDSLLDIQDPTIVNDGPRTEITAVAKLAKRCLSLNGKKRPTMKQVAMELELIKASEEGNVIEDQSGDEESEIDDTIKLWDGIPSCSSTTNDSISLRSNASS